jgi:son of sevenless
MHTLSVCHKAHHHSNCVLAFAYWYLIDWHRCSGVYLTDLTFMGDGNPDKIGKRINYAKHKLVYSVITIQQTYQKVPYNFVPIWSIQEFLKQQPSLSEADVYKQSLIIEPRGADRAQIK